MSITFATPPTVGAFMLDHHFVRLIMGPVGSGKSAGCFMELLRRARQQAPDAHGIRRTRMAIVRNTLQQLRQTCLADIQLWLQPIVNFRVTDQTIQLRIPLPDGTRIESDWLLIPLDTKQDQQRLLSLNLTGAWISEFREIPVELIDAIAGRLGRFPAKAVCPPTWWGIVGESNPPDEDSDWYMKLELDTPPNWGVFKQPGGLTPQAENVANLPPDYYPNLAQGRNQDWVDVHVHAKYGKSLAGQAVFRASFRPDWHVSYDDKLVPMENVPLMIMQDFGRTPASLVGQMDPRGRLIIHREFTSEDHGIEKFATTILRPGLYEFYATFMHYMVADPTGKDKAHISEESAFDVLRRLGFRVYPAPTNDIEPRLRAVEQQFLSAIDAGPAIIINGGTCPLLVTALKSQYRYKRKQTGDLDDKPDKTHPWSDLADCLQYGCLSINNNYIGKVLARTMRPARPPPISPASWT